MKYSFSTERFWIRHPALLYGLSALLGLFAPYSLFIFLAYPLFGLKIKRLGLCFLLAFCSWGFYHLSYSPMQKQEKGTAIFRIDHISATRTPFSNTWTYKGTILSFYLDNEMQPIGKNLPFTLSLPRTSNTPPYLGEMLYQAEGSLKPTGSHRYAFCPAKGISWIEREACWSFAKKRFHCKNWVRNHLKRVIEIPRAASFLIGMATGEFDDFLMSQELGRFGLQHIMAISGFHFSIIAACITFIFRAIFPLRVTPYVVFFLITLYLLFLGSSSSILRAWITASIAILGTVSTKNSLALNSLGVAVMGIVFYDPLQVFTLGFQFSFLITGAILLFYQPFTHLVDKLSPRRRLSQLVEMPLLDQHGYLVLYYVRQALALTLSVSVISLPLSLYYFHKFPIMSLAYNLFFPLLVSFAIILLILALLISCISSPAAHLVHQVNGSFTDALLSLCYNIPTSLDYHIKASYLSSGYFVVYLLAALWLGIFLHLKREKNLSEFWAF